MIDYDKFVELNDVLFSGGSRGGRRGCTPPNITLKCDKAKATLRNRSKSLEIHRTKMTDHFLETPE